VVGDVSCDDTSASASARLPELAADRVRDAEKAFPLLAISRDKNRSIKHDAAVMRSRLIDIVITSESRVRELWSETEKGNASLGTNAVCSRYPIATENNNGGVSFSREQQRNSSVSIKVSIKAKSPLSSALTPQRGALNTPQGCCSVAAMSLANSRGGGRFNDHKASTLVSRR